VQQLHHREKNILAMAMAIEVNVALWIMIGCGLAEYLI